MHMVTCKKSKAIMISASLAIMSFLGAICFAACGDKNESDEQPIGYRYEIVGTKCKIIDCNLPSDMSLVVVPDTIDGYAVNSVKLDLTNLTSSNVSVVIPEGVSSVERISSFSVLDITLPSTVTSIGQFLAEVHNISISPNNDVYYVENKCLIDRDTKTLVVGCCDSVIPSDGSVTAIADGAFSHRKEITAVVGENYEGALPEGGYKLAIPAVVTTLGSFFENCSALEVVEIPLGAEWSGYSAFSGCSSLKSMSLPKCRPSFENMPSSFSDFFGYDEDIPASLEEITITGGNEIILSGAGNVKHIYIKNEATSVGSFRRLKMLEYVELPETVTTIGESAFEDCDSLTTIALPPLLTNIEKRAFFDCDKLSEITLPQGLQSIGTGAFLDCLSLVEIDIPDSVQDIGEGAFGGCSSLEQINVGINNAVYKSVDGALMDNNGTLLRATTAGIIPEGSKIIAPCAFSGLNIDDIIIPGGITSIGDSAFSDCILLKSVTIGANVNYIGDQAFDGCDSLQTAVFAEPSGGKAEGWKWCDVVDNPTAHTSVDTADLSDPSTAALVLRLKKYYVAQQLPYRYFTRG